jgi:ABC-type multidrug transport system fused ATPase/permease subunit
MESSHISTAQALSVVGRGLHYAKPLWKRYIVKVVLGSLALLPPLILIWPLKFLIDNVIGHKPFSALETYPFYIQPLVTVLAGKPESTIIAILLVFGIITVVILGAYGTDAQQRDGVSGELNQGFDTATRTENDVNRATSSMGGFLGYFEYLWSIRISHLLNYRLRNEVFNHTQKLPMSTLEDRTIGDSVYRVMYDTASISPLCEEVIVTPIARIIQISLAFYLLDFSFDQAPTLIWIALTAFPLWFCAFFFLTGPLRAFWTESRVTGSGTTSSMEESLSNILAVQSLGTQRKELIRFSDDSRRSFGGYLKGYGIIMLAYIIGFCMFIGLAVYALVIVTDLIIDGIYTPGDLAVLYTFYFSIFDGSRVLGGLWLTLQSPIAGMRRVFNLLDMPTEERGAGTVLPRMERGIEMRNVNFSYNDKTQVLSDINFSATKGEMIALAGPTGAGKTSLAYLIPRFHSSTGGQILFDGVDVSEYSVASTRSQVSFVFQETTLFEGTVLDNLKLANPEATMDEVTAATKITGAHDFIEALPEKYDTWVGTTGSKLSVGQKQRLSIARGLLKKAEILILDEPTSALDPETEYHLVQTLLKAREDQLVIVIAHRLSTIRSADRIYFLEHGRIIESGNHKELLAQQGAYYDFVQLQTTKQQNGERTPDPS